MTTPRLDLIVLDCPDALELGRFYAEVLDWTMALLPDPLIQRPWSRRSRRAS